MISVAVLRSVLVVPLYTPLVGNLLLDLHSWDWLEISGLSSRPAQVLSRSGWRIDGQEEGSGGGETSGVSLWSAVCFSIPLLLGFLFLPLSLSLSPPLSVCEGLHFKSEGLQFKRVRLLS